jgi:CRISPR-associated protein Cmr2
MNEYLLLFTIGPIQSFIANARKTQDLFSGSFLLSYLTHQTMKKLKKEYNTEFIIPGENAKSESDEKMKNKPDEKTKSKPSRFIARIRAETIEQCGEDLERFVNKTLEEIGNIIVNELHIDLDDFNQSFLNQIRTHLQINWVILPLNEKYAESFKELETYLGAIKNVQNFEQLEERGKKCSLCGKRNVLFYLKQPNKSSIPHATNLKSCDLAPKNMNEGEGLCSICFIKRFLDVYIKKKNIECVIKDNPFPSTASIALMDSLDQIDENILDDYKNIFKPHFDEDFYFKENLTKEFFKEKGYTITIDEAKEKYDTINDQIETKNVPWPKYYALLKFDGDNMGKWLSGEFLEDPDQLEEFHKEVTKKLSKFTENVEQIIKEPKGILVYAGGDDVLAFTNLKHVFEIMKELRETFPELEKSKFKIKNNVHSTASIGVVLAHYKTPLSQVLKWTREMEHEAKSPQGNESPTDNKKNACALAVLKRSGNIAKTKYKWKYNGKSTIDAFQTIITELEENFSSKFMKNLRIEFNRLMNTDGTYNQEEIVKTEIKRLVKRACIIPENDETEKALLQRKNQKITELSDTLYQLYCHSYSMENFLSLLDIIDFIERGGA